MKSEKGITLTSLVIYIIIATIVISTLSVISTFFFSNMNLIKDQNEYAIEFNKFSMFFIEDVKKNRTADVKEEEKKIIFEDGTVYEYFSGAIYRNNKKIAEKVEDVKFSSNEYTALNTTTTKQIIKVNLIVAGSTNTQDGIEYVLKYW